MLSKIPEGFEEDTRVKVYTVSPPEWKSDSYSTHGYYRFYTFFERNFLNPVEDAFSSAVSSANEFWGKPIFYKNF